MFDNLIVIKICSRFAVPIFNPVLGNNANHIGITSEFETKNNTYYDWKNEKKICGAPDKTDLDGTTGINLRHFRD